MGKIVSDVSSLADQGDDPATSMPGILLALSGFIVLSCGDALIKSLAGAWPGTAIAGLRYFLGVNLLAGLLYWKEGKAGFADLTRGVHLARGAVAGFMTVSFFLSIFLMPLATATSITFLSPMLTAFLSGVVLKEPMSRRTWIASLAAFAGVILVLRPNVEAFGLAALLPVCGAFGMATLFVLNRMAGQGSSMLQSQFTMAFWALPVIIVMAVLGHMFALPGLVVSGWPPPMVILICTIVAVTASCSHGLIYLATTRESAAVIAPAVYVQLLMALILGVLFFGDWPDWLSLAGSAVIVASGLWLYWPALQEARYRRAAAGLTRP